MEIDFVCICVFIQYKLQMLLHSTLYNKICIQPKIFFYNCYERITQATDAVNKKKSFNVRTLKLFDIVVQTAFYFSILTAIQRIIMYWGWRIAWWKFSCLNKFNKNNNNQTNNNKFIIKLILCLDPYIVAILFHKSHCFTQRIQTKKHDIMNLDNIKTITEKFYSLNRNSMVLILVNGHHDWYTTIHTYTFTDSELTFTLNCFQTIPVMKLSINLLLWYFISLFFCFFPFFFFFITFYQIKWICNY